MNSADFLNDPYYLIQEEVNHKDLLRKIVIFKNLSQKSLSIIEERMETLMLKKGEQVISENEIAKGVYFVHSGTVKLTKQDEFGNEIIVCIKQQGDVFAEACLFTQKTEHYPATAAMLQDGKVFFLDKLELEQDLYSNPELAMQMIRYMSDALREMTSTLRDVALLDVYAKTVKTLERLGKKFNNGQNRWNIEIPLTVQEFATVVGTSRESVSRVFSKLKKEGLIDLKSRKIIILDWCRLCTLLQRDY
ncbi:MAG: Crp/Fnr family transcriptional regulator [Bacillus sp. (in: Bacteria)]|nr:Crp/Fnr family transcriptional regulator [Bacillus sp. (in: firmicutes)]